MRRLPVKFFAVALCVATVGMFGTNKEAFGQKKRTLVDYFTAWVVLMGHFITWRQF